MSLPILKAFSDFSLCQGHSLHSCLIEQTMFITIKFRFVVVVVKFYPQIFFFILYASGTLNCSPTAIVFKTPFAFPWLNVLFYAISPQPKSSSLYAFLVNAYIPFKTQPRYPHL